MKVHEIMRRQVIAVASGTSLADAMSRMTWADIRHLVVTHDGRVAGILTQQDVLGYRLEIGGAAAMQHPVSEAMSQPVEYADPDDDVLEAEARMADRRIGCLPVLSRGDLVGIVTTTDLLGVHVSSSLRGPKRGVRASEVMTPLPARVSVDAPLFDAVLIMSEHHVRHLPVIDADQRVVGLLSDRDVRSLVGNPVAALQMPGARLLSERLRVRDAMETQVLTVEEDTPLEVLLRGFVTWRIGAVPVVDDRRRPVGIVSYIDVLKALG